MDGETHHLLLPVSVTMAKKTLLAARPDAVRVAVSAWVLFIASIYLVFFAVEWAVHHYHGPCRQQVPPTTTLRVPPLLVLLRHYSL